MRNQWFAAQSAELDWWQNWVMGEFGPRALRGEVLSFIQDNGRKRMMQFGLEELSGSILDVGCALISVHEGVAGREVTAIDPLLGAMAESLPDIVRLGQVDNVTYISGVIQDLEGWEPFDHIWCVNVLDHTDDWRDIISRFGALVKPGGYLLLGVDVRHSPASLNRHHISQICEAEILAEIAGDFITEWHTPFEDKDHYYFVTRSRKR